MSDENQHQDGGGLDSTRLLCGFRILGGLFAARAKTLSECADLIDGNEALKNGLSSMAAAYEGASNEFRDLYAFGKLPDAIVGNQRIRS